MTTKQMIHAARVLVLTLILSLSLMLLPTKKHATETITPFQIDTVTSQQGLTAWLIEDSYLPIISIEFAIEGGSAFDPKGKKGLALMTMHLLDEGAGTLTSQAFQEQLEEHNISLSFWASTEWLRGSLKMLKKDLPKALELFRLATTQPRFDADAIERQKKQTLASIRSQREDPASVAQREWFKRAFPDHPYGVPTIGLEKDIQNITKDDISDFFQRAFNRETLTIAAAGDIRADELAELLDSVFLWQPKAHYRNDTVKTPTLPDAQLHVIDKAIPQTTVYFGRKGIERDHPDFYAYYLFNDIFGQGSFRSRLMQEIREKRGLAYGVSTFLWDAHDIALLNGRLATSNERVHESIALLKAESEKIAREGITAEELAASKTYIISSLYLNLVRTSSLARFALNLQLDGLPRDYPQKREQLFQSITLDDIKRVAQDVLQQDDWIIVAVGKPVLDESKNKKR